MVIPLTQAYRDTRSRIQSRNEFRRLRNLLRRDTELPGNLRIALSCEVIEMMIDDAILQTVMFPETFQLD